MANNPNQSQHNTNEHSQSGERQFRCSDAGFKECNWQVRGKNDNEIMDRVREHGREAHNISNFDDNMRRKVQDNIRNAA